MAVATSAQSPFPGFTKFAPTIWYYNPQNQGLNGTIAATTQPDLVLLSTWMGAASKHILKYVASYQGLFPKSPILMLTSNIKDIVLKTPKQHKEHMKNALHVIHEVASTHENPRILLHLFSNGGAHHITHLAYLYRQQFNTTLPITGMVLDSAPGIATYTRSIAALTVNLPRFILLRILSLVVIHFLCAALWVSHHIFRQESFITKMRRRLINPDLFPITAPRVYIYSKTDKMVGWKDVEHNAELAEANGYAVKLVGYERSEHVGHMRTDPKKYWEAVQSVLQ